jgi:hypothetical protein
LEYGLRAIPCCPDHPVRLFASRVSLSSAAERVGDQLRQATVKAGEKLKSAAEERGLHPEGLKEVAGEVADTFKASMKGESKTTDSGSSAQSHAVDRSK